MPTISMDEIKAKINLHAVLPVMADLEKLDRTHGGKGAGASRGTLVMAVAGRPDMAATIHFKGAGIEVLPERWRKPSLVLEFATPGALNDSFGGGKERPHMKGLVFGWPLLLKFVKLSKLLGDSLMRDRAPGGAKTRAALMLKVVVHAMEVLSQCHAEVQATVKALDGTAQFGIEPDGPVYHITFEKGKAAAYDSKHSSPKSTITWADSETAVAVLSGKLNPMEAMSKQKMKMVGDPGFALQVGGIMNKVGEVLQPTTK